MTNTIEPKIIKKNVEIIVTVQAQKILAQSNYSIEDFLNWVLGDQKISFGGHNVTVFLEKMYDLEVNKNGSSIS